MGAIHNLLERLGYVKLDRYGLLLTPEGRILSSRPAVLDDGLGGRIVGWQDGDLAAMELDKWGDQRVARKQLKAGKPVLPKQLPPAPPLATAGRVAVAMAPTIPAPARPAAPLAQTAVAAVAPAQVAVTPVAVAPAVDAPVEEPQDDEDWEWTIAVARARAAAEEAEQAAAEPKFVAPVKSAPQAAPKFVPAVTSAPQFAPAAQTKPIAMVAPKRQTVTTPPPLPVVEEDTHVGAPAKAEVTQVTAPPQVRPPIVPKTIIPVPTLPRVSDPSQVRPAAVMARGSGPQVSPPLRRVPRGTDRIEDTVRTSAAPANDDKTSPGIVLPPSGGGRRVAAKQK